MGITEYFCWQQEYNLNCFHSIVLAVDFVLGKKKEKKKRKEKERKEKKSRRKRKGEGKELM